MDVWAALRLVKWVGVLLVASGALGAVLPRELDERRRAAWWLATPGFVLTWVAGHALARHAGVSLGAPWISGSMLLSLGALAASVWAVEREGRRWAGLAGLAALVGALALMTWRPA